MTRQAAPDKKPELKPQQRKVLQAQTIDPDGPGTVGRDFEALLRFIAERRGARQWRASTALHEVGARLE